VGRCGASSVYKAKRKKGNETMGFEIELTFAARELDDCRLDKRNTVPEFIPEC
jgi:hypothetical protein